MKSRSVPLEDAEGLTLAHDITGIVPGKSKGAVLRRGRVLGPSDLELLKNVGKASVRVIELEAGEVHEDEAAERLARALAGPGLEVSMPGEAWADVTSTRRGVLKVDVGRLFQINALPEMLVATRQDSTPVEAGDRVARAKVLGLSVAEDQLSRAERIAGEGGLVLGVVPYRPMRAGLVVTGGEVASGRVGDAFGPLLEDRLAEYDGHVLCRTFVPDDPDGIARAVRDTAERGVDIILVTGGMSPDDWSAEGIRRAGARIAFQGAPVSPGAMTLLAYLGDLPVVGVPGGQLAKPRSFFDVILPRLVAGERLEPRDVAAYGHGGLCWDCERCTYPACAFCKGRSSGGHP